MWDFETNLYYHPENSDLETVGEVEWTEPCWSFDLTVVWRDSTGMFYWGSDSGCSCPSPFESIRLEDLERGSSFDVADYFEKRLMDLEERSRESEWARSSLDYVKPQVVELLQRVMK
jgi:hypothetical protein